MPYFSIIIPVYNVAPYLRECLDSVVAQTFTDWEAICVDDGSTDGSGAILDEYAAKDRRFKVIHQENAGVSAARQKGLNVAVGKYIGWIDPDDWIERSHFKNLYDKAVSTDADIVWSDMIENKGWQQKVVSNFCEESAFDVLKAILRRDIRGSLCGKVYKKEFVEKSNAKFPSRMKCEIMEDNFFLAELLVKKPKVSYLPDASYHYMIREGSLSNQGSSLKWWEQAMRATDAIVNTLRGRYDEEVLRYRLAQLKYWMLFEKNVPNEVFKKYHPEIHWLPKDMISFRGNVVFFLSTLGFRKLIMTVRTVISR